MEHSESRRISNLARMEGDFLETALPVQAFATLETPRRWSQDRMHDAFARWIRDLQAHHHLTLGSVVSHELTPQLHLHAAIVAARPLDCTIAELHWLNIIASRNRTMAEVKPYCDGLCGLGYILKSLGSAREESRCSANLTAFAIDSGGRFYGRSSAEKRQVSRIRAQITTAIGKGHFRNEARRRLILDVGAPDI